ncbi:hypothetical protein KSF78_0007740 [Schistosoma japonicum]|nr:hypothetical protein KSF78_0007740 [Schistosoma japonicum]
MTMKVQTFFLLNLIIALTAIEAIRVSPHIVSYNNARLRIVYTEGDCGTCLCHIERAYEVR